MASVPPQRTTANDDDGRLPWLDANSPRPGDAAVKADAGLGSSAMRWLVLLVIAALVAAGAFFFGRQGDVTPAPVARRAPSLATTPLVAARPARREVVPAPVHKTEPAPVQKTAPALARADAAMTRRPRAARLPPLLHLRPEQLRDVRRIARAARVRVHHNETPKIIRQVYSPRVGAPGQVVQLGAYRTVAEAEAAAQRFRYKYRGLLAAMPKAVLPFRPKDSRRMFYRVQFIVPSQVYAEVTCQRLRAAAKTCIVVY